MNTFEFDPHLAQPVRLALQIIFCCQAVTKVTGSVMSSLMKQPVTDRCHGVAKAECLETANL